MENLQAWLKQQAAHIRDAYNSLDLPPVVRMSILIAAAGIPFIAFVAFQSADDPQQSAAPQEPADLSQRVPLNFPFGTPEPSVSPSADESPSAAPTPTRTTPANPPPPPPASQPSPPAPAPPSPSPAAPSPSPSAQPSPSPSPSPTVGPSPSPSPTAPVTQCNDGIDNDNDGDIDGKDSGCRGSTDNDERVGWS